jgi:phosphoribosylglycinamide formyltransferase-1
MNFAVIISTGGSVLSALLRNSYFRQRILCVVADRECNGIASARQFQVPTIIHETRDGLEFSDFLLERFRNAPPDLFVSFYTRLFRGEFVAFAQNRLVNLHPSILPACPGPDGFGDTIRSRSRFIGATVHFVDAGMDTGTPIIQSASPFDPNKSLAENRHSVFVQQCKMLLQTIKYFDEHRLECDEDRNVLIKGARYDPGEFAPNLDDDLPFEEPSSMPPVHTNS